MIVVSIYGVACTPRKNLITTADFNTSTRISKGSVFGLEAWLGFRVRSWLLRNFGFSVLESDLGLRVYVLSGSRRSRT